MAATGTNNASGQAGVLATSLRPADLANACRPGSPWLWHGYLGPGKLTLLTSQWKSGKSTLLSVLLARMGMGGSLAGVPVSAGRAVVLSEESPEEWEPRCRLLKMGEHIRLACRPYTGRPTIAEWHDLAGELLDFRRREGLDLVAIDTLTMFFPNPHENVASAMMDNLQPLRQLTAAGLAVLLIHHPTKGATTTGQAARGSGALLAHTDVIIEKYYFAKPEDTDRRRWLRAFSRYNDTRRNLLIELTTAGDDYLVPDLVNLEGWDEYAHALKLVLGDAWDRLSVREILEKWPDDFQMPDFTTINRALKRGLEKGEIRQLGTGRKNDPFRYWLPGKEVDFFPGPGASEEELDRWNTHLTDKLLGSQNLDDARQSPAATSGETQELKAAEPKPSPAEDQPAPATDLALTETSKEPAPAPAQVLVPGQGAQETSPVIASPTTAVPPKQPPAMPAAPASPPPEIAPAKAAPDRLPPPAANAAPAGKPPTPTAEQAAREARRRARRWPYG
jgi:hypothetical protein